MSVLKKNIAANFGGNAWTGLMGLVFVPLYIHFIGIEAYGLMGIFASLLGLFALLDMGLSVTINRELARLSVQEDSAQDMRDLVKTLEIIYWVVAVLIALVVILSSPLIAYHWVQVKELAPNTVRNAIMLMGLCVAFRWPIAFYGGGLIGLQRHVLLNVINAMMATLRGLGAVMILWLVSPTVEAFFTWQIVITFVHVVVMVFFLWRSLPHAPIAPRFRRKQILSIWRFATGVTGITVLAAILTQLDKVILSRMLSLDLFGYYALAGLVAITLTRFVGPVFTATYPKLCSLVKIDAEKEIEDLYHKSAQLVSVLVLPPALIVAIFSKEVLLMWTRDPVIVENTHLLVSLLITGTAINSIMHIPLALQLANGWTKLAFVKNLIAVTLLVPLIFLLTKWFGAVGAACVWVILNTGYLLFEIPFMHRRLLTTEKWRWYFDDVGRPLFAALVVAVFGRLVIKLDWSPFLLITAIGIVSAGSLLASACAANRLMVVARGRALLTTLRTRYSGTVS